MSTPELAPSPLPTPSGIAVVRPGDTLLIVFERNLSQEEAEQVAEEFRAHLDPAVKLAILDGAEGCTVTSLPPNLARSEIATT